MPIEIIEQDTSVRDDIISAFKTHSDADEIEHGNKLQEGEEYAEGNPLGDQAKKDDDAASAAKSKENDAAKAGKEKEPKDGDDDKKEKKEDDDIVEPPVKWTAEEKQAFVDLQKLGNTPEHAKHIIKVQKILSTRNKEMEGHFTRRNQELATQTKDFETANQQLTGFKDLLKPYEADYNRMGVEPAAMVKQTLAIEQFARTKPEEFIKWFAENNKWDASKVGEMFGVQPGATEGKVVVLDEAGNVIYEGVDNRNKGAQAPPNSAPTPQQQPQQQQMQMPPEFMQQFTAMQEQLNGMNQSQAHAENQRATTLLQQFENTTDAAGNSKYPFYHDVAARMADFMEVDTALTIEGAYNAAVASNPELSQKMFDSRELAMRRDMERTSTADAQKARQAGAALPTSSVPLANPNDDAGETSLEDQLRAGYRKYMGNSGLV